MTSLDSDINELVIGLCVFKLFKLYKFMLGNWRGCQRRTQCITERSFLIASANRPHLLIRVTATKQQTEYHHFH